MFTQAKGRGRQRDQSSWQGEWSAYSNDSSYRDNQSRSSQDNYQQPPQPQQSYSRGHNQDDSKPSSNVICQNFLQNKCLRGNNCLFIHPPSSSSSGSSNTSSQLASSLNSKRTQNPWLNFCSDFQKGTCPYSDDCRLLHVSQRDEANYQSTGDVPSNVVEQAMAKAMSMDWAYVGTKPHCKNYLHGSCETNRCIYRHLNTDQYVVEVLAALREKFLMPRREMFPEKSNYLPSNLGDKSGERRGQDSSKKSQSDQGGNGYGSGSTGYEADSKRRRGFDYESNDRQGNSNNSGYSQGRESYSTSAVSQGSSNENYVDSLRRQNMDALNTNKQVKKTAFQLEDDNSELRKALKLALEINTRARSLDEFRSQLHDIQMNLKKKGIGSNNMPASTGSWNNKPLDSGSSSHNGMRGDRYSSSMSNSGYDNNDRWDTQRSSSSSSRLNNAW